MSDERGVLGNLPRSRPGHRSERRSTTKPKRVASQGRKVAQRPAPSARKRSDPNARQRSAPPRARATADARAATAEARAGTATRSSAGPPRDRREPLTEAVRLAGKVADVYVKSAEIGLKTAAKLLRRLPPR